MMTPYEKQKRQVLRQAVQQVKYTMLSWKNKRYKRGCARVDATRKVIEKDLADGKRYSERRMTLLLREARDAEL